MDAYQRDADIENGYVDTLGEGEVETKWENTIDIYTQLCEK